ncbi:MAG: thioredoxin family protein [Acidobacteriota bacterium]|nr:thioredoxin family protein [Acidobacteriota bacterium]
MPGCRRMAGRHSRLFPAVLLLAIPGLFAAQDPVQWTLTVQPKAAPPGSHLLGRLTGKIESGWHLYSPTTPKGGPIPTTIALSESPLVASVQAYEPKPERKLDPNFQLETETFSDEVVFLLDIELRKDAVPGLGVLEAAVRYQCCSDKLCLPPRKKTASGGINIDAAAPPSSAIAIPADYTEFKTAVSRQSTNIPTPAPAPARAESQDFGRFLLIAFGAGLAAIFTPCVFPMIPFTVSYFLKRENTRQREGVLQALVFCLGIIVMFTGLGLITKAIAGPFGVVQLGNSPWVNGFVALVFVVFGLSLLGAYELTLPSGLLTKMDQASQRGGYGGTLLMGLTFTLTSFACIGPIVGPLLVASVQTGGLQPVFGMMAFAAGLATPFFVLALFPSYLQRLPKSGGWLMRVKVVLGFIVLAVSLKYLSSVDQVLQKNLISRELFLAAWVVLFALPGLYLLGFLRLEGVKSDERLGVGRMLVAAVFLIFALTLLPGLFGGSLGGLEGFIPVSSKAGLNTCATAASPVWMKNQYREALAKARQENKLVFVNFTGYACTNCHWMKANMFPRPEIAGLLNNFVLVDLFTDGTDAVSEQNQQLEEKRFGTVAIPFYAVLDPDEHVLATFPGLTKNPGEFVSFLNSGTGQHVGAKSL